MRREEKENDRAVSTELLNTNSVYCSVRNEIRFKGIGEPSARLTREEIRYFGPGRFQSAESGGKKEGGTRKKEDKKRDAG